MCVCVDVSARCVFTPVFSLRCSYMRAISTNETSGLPETAALLTALCQRFVPTRLFFLFLFPFLKQTARLLPSVFSCPLSPLLCLSELHTMQFKLLTLPSQKSVSVQASKQFNKMIITAVEVQSNKGHLIKF